MKDVVEILALNIKKRRKELGITQSELASLLGYSEKTVSKWECGNGAPPTIVLPELAKKLETSVDALLYENQTSRLFLGIDGGGTKTEFALSDIKGNIIKSVTLGATNPNDIGMAQAKEIIRKGVFLCCGDRALGTVSAFAGIAGSSSKENHYELSDFLSQFGFMDSRLGSDAENAVAASLGFCDGITVIIGTGAVAFAKCKGKLHRVGGYGYLFGDAGSGFSIGRDVILAALKDEDGSGDRTVLHSLVKEKCGCSYVLDGLDGFYRGGKREIAKYAPAAFEAYRRGDSVARAIIESNVRAISDMIIGAAKHFDGGIVRTVLCGGVTRDADIIIPMLEKMLGMKSENFDMGICNKPPVYGALLLAGIEKEE